MGKKKKSTFKLKLNKKQRALLRAIGIPVAAGLLCLNIGILGTRYFEARKQPTNLVWAADKTIRVPADLRDYLLTLHDCKGYRGTDSPEGVGLWGVYQVSHDKFAKISYGCSLSLSNYIMAVKVSGKWQLLQPAQYFSPFENSNSIGAIPLCSQVDMYKIDKSIESFCANADGSVRENTN